MKDAIGNVQRILVLGGTSEIALATVRRLTEGRPDADVTLAIDRRYSFPKDTSAAILTSGLLGENYVGLDAGGDDQKLKDGDRIAITQSAVVLERLIGQFLFSKAQEEPAGGGAAKLPEPPGVSKK